MKNNLINMMALDIYLSAISENNFNKIYSEIEPNELRLPLMSWDLYSEVNSKKMNESRRFQDIIKIKSLASKFNWQNNMDAIFETEQFEAIIVTDINQKILWVNNGFSDMTGFTKTEALAKTPRFLQGSKTSTASKQRIRKRLKADLPFKDVIINHKKNGTPYKCEVKIFPLHNNGNKTHYIALERQVG
ncbi:PAS domain-containing protein [Winogradskyella haliclonae]|uniref:PAS domain-containing protein n=1 Tax=Winogradskyella haliclonae TaxID=2048558 RepID=A0ABQ2BZH6_9FLAO|nr:PAS domain-containing protein [Winogradskyella haliclonae]GGI57906.1 hypothetical protein GCM10011444_22150 [Winogradskyella haliclonae]